MAEALARHLLPDSIKVGSAGIKPLGYIAEETLLVLAEAGIATEDLSSKGLGDLNLAEFALMVNLTASALAAHLLRGFHGRVVRHPVVDPFGSTLQVYREAREAIRQFITADLPSWLLNR